MNTIIADNLRTEQTVSTRIDLFFKQIGLSNLLKKSNFYKESGIPCVEILKTLFTLVFTDKNLYRTLETNSGGIGFKKNTAYRFLNSMRYNWSRLLTLTASNVINTVNAATSEDRVNVLIIDDSFYDRNRSKKVELLARVFDHSMHKYVKGFKMLTLGWSDGSTFIPVSFSLLSSRKESNILCPANEGIDKRTNAYKRRKSAVSSATEALFELLDTARHLPAKYVLFDSWFAFPKTIYKICKRNYDVICMIKNSPKIHYGHNGEWIDLAKLHSIVKKKGMKKGQILGSIQVCIRESRKNPETIDVKIVFVEDRNSKSFLAVLSTDTSLSDDEVLRIYGKRWDIEVFFKMCKSYLALSKEFQGRSYDMMTAHTTIVFLRYIMLSLEARNSVDHRTVGGLFYLICDEIEDIRFAEALTILLEILRRTLEEFPAISEKTVQAFLTSFFNSLPSLWKSKLQLCA
ncbi:MAG TPA: transposase [Clostridiales bacterium]|jgi:hypothetical protein|nr:transposase [Clostridiales bacterium]